MMRFLPRKVTRILAKRLSEVANDTTSRPVVTC
jgi:hypothetical protein